MGKITQKLPSKDEIPKLKRRRRRKDLDDIYSRILKTTRKSDDKKERYNKDQRSKQKQSKNPNKHMRTLHTGIFRNGTKSKNVKKGKLEDMVSEARLVGDMLKLFGEESETICISENMTENEPINQLSTEELVENNLERTLHTLKNSPVLGRNHSKNRTKYLENVSKENKEIEIVIEPIDIPEVVIDQNFGTKNTMKEEKKKKQKKDATYSEHSKITSCNQDLHDSYMKLCAKVSDEYKNVLNFMEDPLLATQRKLKKIFVSLRTKHTQHETVQQLQSSKSSTSSAPRSVSEHQACTYFSKNQNSISCPFESNQHNTKDFSVNRILSIDSNSRRDEKCLDITIIQDSHSKLPLKKRVSITAPPKQLSTQLDDEEIIAIDCNVPNNILQKYSKVTSISESTNEKKFFEMDVTNMFQNLPTPSTVNRQFYRSRKPKSRNESIKIKYSEKFEEPDIDLRADVSNRQDKVVQFRNCVHSQAPLEVLTAAAAFVETGHLPQTETGNLFIDKYVPSSSNSCNSFNQQPLSFYRSQNAGPSNCNVEPAKQKHYASQNTHRCEERHTNLNCSNRSHEYNISQAHRQNYAETVRTTVASGSSYFPIHYNSVASNYANLPYNVEHTRVLPNHGPYTYLQQVDDRQCTVCLQNFTQPVKYFALDNGVNVHKIPLYHYVKNCVCQYQNHGHNGICPHWPSNNVLQ